MKARPWPIVILAACHVVAPAVNLALCARMHNVSSSIFLRHLGRTLGFWGAVDFFLVLPLAGVAIFACRRWSYPVFLGVAAETILQNYLAWKRFPYQFPLWALALTTGLDVVLVSYFLLPAVRITYLDAKVRWWESKPRYLLERPASVSGGGLAEASACVLNDVSEGGVSLRASLELERGTRVRVSFEAFGQAYEIEGHVVYSRGGEEKFYGIELTRDARTRKPIKLLARELKKRGVVPRNHVDLGKDFVTWATQLVTTGKGIVPTIPPASRKPAENASAPAAPAAARLRLVEAPPADDSGKDTDGDEKKAA